MSQEDKKEKQEKQEKKRVTNCETCVNYIYDEEMDYYCCDKDLDEDEMYRFLTGSFQNCPFYQLYDEYKVVRKQM